MHPFAACRARLRVNYWAHDNDQDYLLGSTLADIPTACSRTDPFCSNTQSLNVTLPNAITGTIFGMPKTAVTDHITVSAEPR